MGTGAEPYVPDHALRFHLEQHVENRAFAQQFLHIGRIVHEYTVEVVCLQGSQTLVQAPPGAFPGEVLPAFGMGTDLGLEIVGGPGHAGERLAPFLLMVARIGIEIVDAQFQGGLDGLDRLGAFVQEGGSHGQCRRTHAGSPERAGG